MIKEKEKTLIGFTSFDAQSVVETEKNKIESENNKMGSHTYIYHTARATQ